MLPLAPTYLATENRSLLYAQLPELISLMGRWARISEVKLLWANFAFGMRLDAVPRAAGELLAPEIARYRLMKWPSLPNDSDKFYDISMIFYDLS